MLIDIIILVYGLGYIVAWRKCSAYCYRYDYNAYINKNQKMTWGTVVVDGIGGAVVAIFWPIVGVCIFIRDHSTPETAARRVFGENAKQKTARIEKEKRDLLKRTKELEVSTGMSTAQPRLSPIYTKRKKRYNTWD